MAKDTTFPHPLKGHVGLLCYDSVNDQWQAVYVDASGSLQVDIVSSALPTGAATAANQTTMITALQLIDDLRNALDSVGTDEFDVNIEASIALDTQLLGYDGDSWEKLGLLFSYNDRISGNIGVVSSAAGWKWTGSITIPAGEIWVIQHMKVSHNDSSARDTILRAYDGATTINLKRDTAWPATNIMAITGQFVMKAGDYPEAGFNASASGKEIELAYWGYKMKLSM